MIDSFSDKYSYFEKKKKTHTYDKLIDGEMHVKLASRRGGHRRGQPEAGNNCGGAINGQDGAIDEAGSNRTYQSLRLSPRVGQHSAEAIPRPRQNTVQRGVPPPGRRESGVDYSFWKIKK